MIGAGTVQAGIVGTAAWAILYKILLVAAGVIPVNVAVYALLIGVIGA